MYLKGIAVGVLLLQSVVEGRYQRSRFSETRSSSTFLGELSINVILC